MMSLNKIRILWIDDRERITGFPEMKLPSDLNEFFEVMHQSSIDGNLMSYESAEEFMPEFLTFWINKVTDILPVEIIAADYNLNKYAQAAQTDGIAPDMNIPQGVSDISETNSGGSHKIARDVNFDGLLIGSFYAAMTYRHPAVLVSITNYDDKMPNEVITLKHLISPFISVPSITSSGNRVISETPLWSNLSANLRSWRNIISAGLPPLRKRVMDLYDSGSIIIPPTDLFSIIDGVKNSFIRIQSPHALRIIPIAGLFYDEKEDSRKWAEKILELKITRDQFQIAEELAGFLWRNYNDDDLIENYRKVSHLHLTDRTCDEYKTLVKSFSIIPTGKGPTCNNLVEIRGTNITSITNEEDVIVRRWAALFLVRNLFKRLLLFIKMTNLDAHGKQYYPDLTSDDILLLFFVIPQSPFPAPWFIQDSKLRNNKKAYWRDWLVETLDLDPNRILDGTALSQGERQILKGIVMSDDIELGDDPSERLEAWESVEQTKTFLFGREKMAEQ